MKIKYFLYASVCSHGPFCLGRELTSLHIIWARTLLSILKLFSNITFFLNWKLATLSYLQKHFMKAVIWKFFWCINCVFLFCFPLQQKDCLGFNLHKTRQEWFLWIDLRKGLQGHLVVRKCSLGFSIITVLVIVMLYCNAQVNWLFRYSVTLVYDKYTFVHNCMYMLGYCFSCPFHGVTKACGECIFSSNENDCLHCWLWVANTEVWIKEYHFKIGFRNKIRKVLYGISTYLAGIYYHCYAICINNLY